MGFGSLLRKTANLAKTASKIPGVGLIPGVGQVVSAAGLIGGAYSAYSALKPSGGGGLPALPGGSLAGMPVTGGAGYGLPAAPGMGERGILRDDPNVVEALKAFAIPQYRLKTYARAPKGFVVMRDQVGDPYGIPKEIARKYLGWKPAKKPLLSVRDTNAIRRAGTAIKKLQNAEKMAKKIANWKSGSRRREIVIERKQLPTVTRTVKA